MTATEPASGEETFTPTYWSVVLYGKYFVFRMNITNMKVRRRQWHPTPVLLPGKSHGQRSLVGYSPQVYTESDMTEAT